MVGWFTRSPKKLSDVLRPGQIKIITDAYNNMIYSLKPLFVNESDIGTYSKEETKMDFMRSRLKNFLEKSSFGLLINQSDLLLETKDLSRVKDYSTIKKVLSELCVMKHNLNSDYYLDLGTNSIFFNKKTGKYYLRKFCGNKETPESVAEDYLQMLHPLIQIIQKEQ